MIWLWWVLGIYLFIALWVFIYRWSVDGVLEVEIAIDALFWLFQLLPDLLSNMGSCDCDISCD